MLMIRTLTLLTVLFSSLCIESVSAQIFGPRNVGRNATRRANMSSAGTPDETRRFVRGQRAAEDFVGSDKTDASAFVGNTAAVNDGEVTSAVVGLREQAAVQVNRRRVRRSGGLYAERLSAHFLTNPNGAPDAASFSELSHALVQYRNDRKLDVTVASQTATLSGTVATQHELKIAELLLLLEPSVSTVKNDLTVTAPGSK